MFLQTVIKILLYYYINIDDICISIVIIFKLICIKYITIYIYICVFIYCLCGFSSFNTINRKIYKYNLPDVNNQLYI